MNAKLGDLCETAGYLQSRATDAGIESKPMPLREFALGVATVATEVERLRDEKRALYAALVDLENSFTIRHVGAGDGAALHTDCTLCDRVKAARVAIAKAGSP